MSNVKVLPPDAFVLNCKMTLNDVSQIQDRVRRMWACANSDADYALMEWVEIQLVAIRDAILDRLDK